MKSHFLLTGMTTLGWDCIVIPGARKGTASATFTGDSGRPMRWCGQSEGLVIKADGDAGTICCKNSLHYVGFRDIWNQIQKPVLT